MSHLDARPLLIVISGPSGAGKGTALEAVTDLSGARRVPTYTTRAPRASEVEGRDYQFLDEARFFELFKLGEIVEYTRTYSSSVYGSPRALLDTEGDLALVTELDPKGFVAVRARTARRIVGIFVTTTSKEALVTRIRLRGNEYDLGNRIRIRTDQLTWSWNYDYVIYNEDLAQFREEVQLVVRSEMLKTSNARRMLHTDSSAEDRTSGVESGRP